MYKIILVNGKPRAGKTTFAGISSGIVNTINYSSIDCIKEVAKLCGWDGVSKTEKDRKFLSDLKILTSDYSNMSRKKVLQKAKQFTKKARESVQNWVLLIDVREPYDLDFFKKELNAITLFISNSRVPHISSNVADANVNNYDYDYVIVNDGTLNDFMIAIDSFYEEINWDGSETGICL